MRAIFYRIAAIVAVAHGPFVSAQLKPGESSEYGDPTRGRFGDPSDGYFGDPSAGQFGSRFPAEPWAPLPPSDTSAVDTAPYVVLPGPEGRRADRIGERQARDPREPPLGSATGDAEPPGQ